MNTIKSSNKNNYEASYNSSGFGENDTNYITQKNFYAKNFSQEQSPNFESDEFITFKKTNSLNNSNNNITATFYKKSKNSNEEIKEEDLYANERRKKKVLNMIKNAHIEKIKNYIYLKEINFAYEQMQRYINEGDLASAKEMERYLNSIQMDIINHNIDNFSKTKLARSHATFGQSFNNNMNLSSRINYNNEENTYANKIINRNCQKKDYYNNNYGEQEEDNIKINYYNKEKKKNKAKKKQKTKEKGKNNEMNIPMNNINRINNSERNYNKTYEYELNNLSQKSPMNNNNIIYNNFPNNNVNYGQSNSYPENINKNQINYDEQNNINNNEIKEESNNQNKIYESNNNINENNIKNINEEIMNEKEINPELNEKINNIDNINNINQNENEENENIGNNSDNIENLSNNQYENEIKMDNINPNIDNNINNNNYDVISRQEQNLVNSNEGNQISNIPNEQNNKEYPNNLENNIKNKNEQIPKEKESNINPEINPQNSPYNNNYQMNQEINPSNDNKNNNNNIPFNPDNAFPNNKYPNYDDLNKNRNPNNLINLNTASQKPERDFNTPYNNNNINPLKNKKKVLRNPRPTQNKMKRPKSSKGPLINKNNYNNVPNFTYPRKYYHDDNKIKTKSKSSSRNRSNTPKILFAEPSRGKCFACDVNCSISRSGNSPNKYVPYYGPLKKERKHITEYDGEKYGYYQYKSRIPESY